MLRIDPLLFSFLLEFLFIFLGLTIYLFFKYRRQLLQSSLLPPNREWLIDFLGGQLGQMQETSMQAEEEGGDIGATILEKGQLFKKRFLTAVLDELSQDGKTQGKALWERLYDLFNQHLTESLEEIRTSLAGYVREDAYKEEIDRLKSMVESQRRRIGELIDGQDRFNDLGKRFQSIREINQEIKESLKKLITEAQASEELKEMLRSLEQNNKELALCVQVLEMENERLFNEMKEIYNRYQIPEEFVPKKEFDQLMAEKDQLLERISLLERELATKIRSYKELQHNYQLLEEEYLSLYKTISPYIIKEQKSGSG